jgi:hypothetical protein
MRCQSTPDLFFGSFLVPLPSTVYTAVHGGEASRHSSCESGGMTSFHGSSRRMDDAREASKKTGGCRERLARRMSFLIVDARL